MGTARCQAEEGDAAEDVTSGYSYATECCDLTLGLPLHVFPCVEKVATQDSELSLGTPLSTGLSRLHVNK